MEIGHIYKNRIGMLDSNQIQGLILQILVISYLDSMQIPLVTPIIIRD